MTFPLKYFYNIYSFTVSNVYEDGHEMLPNDNNITFYWHASHI